MVTVSNRTVKVGGVCALHSFKTKKILTMTEKQLTEFVTVPAFLFVLC